MGNSNKYRPNFFKNTSSNHGWYTCVRCGKKLREDDVEVDHILPQKYGGGNGLDNLQCMCKHCNSSKGASLRDTIPDYARNNMDRAKRSISSLFKD